MAMHTTSQMGSLAGKASSSGFFPTRSRGVLGVGGFPVLFGITICPARVHGFRMLCDIGRIAIFGIRDRRTDLDVHIHFVMYLTQEVSVRKRPRARGAVKRRGKKIEKGKCRPKIAQPQQPRILLQKFNWFFPGCTQVRKRTCRIRPSSFDLEIRRWRRASARRAFHSA